MAMEPVIELVIQQSGDFMDWMICVTEWNPGPRRKRSTVYIQPTVKRHKGNKGDTSCKIALLSLEIP